MSTETEETAGSELGPAARESTTAPRVAWVRHRETWSWWGYAGAVRVVDVRWRPQPPAGEYHWVVVSHLPMDVPVDLIGSDMPEMAKAHAEKFVQRFLTRIRAQWRTKS